MPGHKRSDSQLKALAAVVRQLESVPLSSMRDKALTELLRAADVMDLKGGESVWNADNARDKIYLLYEGSVKLSFTAQEILTAEEEEAMMFEDTEWEKPFDVLPVCTAWVQKIVTGVSELSTRVLHFDGLMRSYDKDHTNVKEGKHSNEHQLSMDMLSSLESAVQSLNRANDLSLATQEHTDTTGVQRCDLENVLETKPLRTCWFEAIEALSKGKQQLEEWRLHHMLCLDAGILMRSAPSNLLLHQEMICICRLALRWLVPANQALQSFTTIIVPGQQPELHLYPLTIIGNGVLTGKDGYLHPCTAIASGNAKLLEISEVAYKRANVVETYQFLSSLEPFKSHNRSTTANLFDLAAQATMRFACFRDLIVPLGSPAQSIFVVVSGQLKVSCSSAASTC